MESPPCQVIYAPSNEEPRYPFQVFMAGSTSADGPDWRLSLRDLLLNLPVTLYNPYRRDWDSSWREEIDFAPYREQVEWELQRQEQSNVVVIYFHPATQAPISLLELGLCAKTPTKAIVVCPEGYWKRGNVQIVCKKYGVEVVETVEGLREAIMRRMSIE